MLNVFSSDQEIKDVALRVINDRPGREGRQLEFRLSAGSLAFDQPPVAMAICLGDRIAIWRNYSLRRALNQLLLLPPHPVR